MNKQNIQTVKSLDELKRRASAILEISDNDLREQFVGIARSETATQTADKAFDLAVKHFGARMARSYALATRYLAVIRRDHGEEVFEQVV